MSNVWLIVSLVGTLALVAVIPFVQRDYARARATPEQRMWLKEQSGRFGFFPPMQEPLGRALMLVSLAGIGGALGALFVAPQAMSPLALVGVVTNLWTNHRNLKWMHAQPEYVELGRTATAV